MNARERAHEAMTAAGLRCAAQSVFGGEHPHDHTCDSITAAIKAAEDAVARRSVMFVEHHCERCGDGGFAKAGTGYDAVCGDCGGQSVHLHPPQGLAEALASRTGAMLVEIDRLEHHYTTLHPRELYHEDRGNVLWWKLPITEPPYCGTPLDDDFPDYVTHWTLLPEPDGTLMQSLPKDDWARCQTCGVGRDPADTRSRCRSRRGLFGQRRCDLPEGHLGYSHDSYLHGNLLSWSTDEKDCDCGLRQGHEGECYKDKP